RLAHTVTGFFVTTGFVVVAVAAWLIRKGRSVEEGRVMLSMTFWLLTFLVPLQIFLGDQHGLNTAHHQPAKVAAIEARWNTQPSFPLTLFAIPDPAKETNRYAIEVPYLGSLILPHSLHGEIRGLKEFKPEARPPVAIPFFAFRVMVGIGFLMLAVVSLSWWLRYRDRLFDSPGFSGSAWRWARSASSPCWPDGRRRRSAASPGLSTACCAPPTRCRPRSWAPTCSSPCWPTSWFI